jgi:hypothetical protein
MLQFVLVADGVEAGLPSPPRLFGAAAEWVLKPA